MCQPSVPACVFAHSFCLPFCRGISMEKLRGDFFFFFFFHLRGETVHLCKDSPLQARWPPTDCTRRWKRSPGRRKKQRSTDRPWLAADNAGETRGHKHNRPITFHKWVLRVISGIENKTENLTDLPFLLRVTHLVFFQATFLAFYHVTDSAPLYKSI